MDSALEETCDVQTRSFQVPTAEEKNGRDARCCSTPVASLSVPSPVRRYPYTAFVEHWSPTI